MGIAERGKSVTRTGRAAAVATRLQTCATISASLQADVARTPPLAVCTPPTTHREDRAGPTGNRRVFAVSGPRVWPRRPLGPTYWNGDRMLGFPRPVPGFLVIDARPRPAVSHRQSSHRQPYAASPPFTQIQIAPAPDVSPSQLEIAAVEPIPSSGEPQPGVGPTVASRDLRGGAACTSMRPMRPTNPRPTNPRPTHNPLKLSDSPRRRLRGTPRSPGPLSASR